MGYALFIMGPAGSGKSTLCKKLKELESEIDRTFTLVNLDPFQENIEIYDITITDTLDITDIMNNLDLGPNGALLKALNEYSDYIEEIIDEENFYIFDLPGQLEFFTHNESIMNIILTVSKSHNCLLLYLMDTLCFTDIKKFLSSSLVALIGISRFCIPYYLVRSKADQKLDYDVYQECEDRLGNTIENKNEKYDELNTFDMQVYQFLKLNGMLDFFPLNYEDDSLNDLVSIIDNLVLYYEYEDFKMKDYEL